MLTINYLAMKKLTINWFNYLLLVCFSLSFFYGNAQKSNEDYLFDGYTKYSKLPREIAHGYLNKSSLIKGESLGLSICLLDKYTEKSSVLTKNVCCTIQNKSATIVKKKMGVADNGVASGIFEIDSLFKSGNYVFKTYTNLMQNFEEQNFYMQQIKVIILDQDALIEAIDNALFELEVQCLPESGHLFLNTKNKQK
jgi:hypothetical protein